MSVPAAAAELSPRQRSRTFTKPFAHLDLRRTVHREIRDQAMELMSRHRKDITDSHILADAIEVATLRIKANAAGRDPDVPLRDYLKTVELYDNAFAKFTGARPS